MPAASGCRGRRGSWRKVVGHQCSGPRVCCTKRRRSGSAKGVVSGALCIVWFALVFVPPPPHLNVGVPCGGF
eukprot:11201730-Lingulodinium_polyedra.AAC.1